MVEGHAFVGRGIVGIDSGTGERGGNNKSL